MADAAAGCLLYEIDHPLNSAGSITYTTEMDGILCVPLRDLVMNNCVIQDAVYNIDSDKYTVGSYATGQPAFLSSYKGSINLDKRNYFQREGKKSDLPGISPVGKWDDTPLIKYLPWNGVARMDFNTSGHATGSFDYITGTFERSSSVADDLEDQIEDTLKKLHERLVDISRTEWIGQYYLPAANCHFYGDEPDSIAGTDNTANSVDELDSEITLATTKYGGKDPGADIDVFYIDMLQDVEYEVHIEGLDPTSEDARLALNKLDISRESNHSISEIEPTMKVLAADGNELALVLHGGDQDVHARRYSPVLLRGTGRRPRAQAYVRPLQDRREHCR